jgi:pimeloyl-ACP methyl ester carboxylesterase
VAATQPAAAPTAERPTSSPIPGDDQAPTADKSEVQIEAGDGLLISGTFYPGAGAPPWPGILLLHMLSGDRSQWDDFVPHLIENGYAVLAVDLRGHGITGGQMDWEMAKADVLIAWNYMAEREDVDQGNTALIGASIGANLALVAASNEPEIKTVVLLSPGLDYRGVTTIESLEAFGDRPSFLAASKDDQYAAESSNTLAESALGEVELQIFEGAGHGTVILSSEPELAVSIIDWLERFVK